MMIPILSAIEGGKTTSPQAPDSAVAEGAEDFATILLAEENHPGHPDADAEGLMGQVSFAVPEDEEVTDGIAIPPEAEDEADAVDRMGVFGTGEALGSPAKGVSDGKPPAQDGKRIDSLQLPRNADRSVPVDATERPRIAQDIATNLPVVKPDPEKTLPVTDRQVAADKVRPTGLEHALVQVQSKGDAAGGDAAKLALQSTIARLEKLSETPARTTKTGREIAAAFGQSTAAAPPRQTEVAMPMMVGRPDAKAVVKAGQARAFEVLSEKGLPGPMTGGDISPAPLAGTDPASPQILRPASAIPMSADTTRSVANQLMLAVSQSRDGTTEVALNPPELGHVKIALKGTEGQMQVQIFADRPDTTELMRRHIDVLAQEFRSLGYANLSFSFGSRGDDTSDTRGQPEAPGDSQVEGIEDAPVSRSTLRHSGAVDLRL